MVAHGRVELLAHPLSQKYLQMKWNSYGKYFHLANLLFYSIFLLFVTVYAFLLMSSPDTITLKKLEKCSIKDLLKPDLPNSNSSTNHSAENITVKAQKSLTEPLARTYKC